ncbi:MAG TPA: phosphoribosyl-AMP cyclohydrolase [Tepidisphaeraceae bacterium]|nr:phosphoribosyl-AMP cyclohydrolase [Tepidisphaeraceae bacterium]
MSTVPDDLKFDDQGLIPAIAQDHVSGKVLMVAWMNRESLARTLETRKVHYWSRSRKKLWFKGEESGNVQLLKGLRTDCDKDVLLLQIEQIGGAACHEGYESCFFRDWSDDGRWRVDGQRVFDPEQVYGKK